ncbi:hypothetical protein H072_3110 [Dactylellina haptotyla CBS 200.50]|uniref:Protein kinase domain-containing protein n=1 Tax=Dactylellina haptotyla (strain CBS 200.50) TaxID=1284197 RepID=S8AJ04_DACHA|nr:hypothetical protein H072_3110 [Dactylellina haptotyla CBS 200.50]
MAGLFNAAIKSLSTASLSSQYSLSPQPTSYSGPWKVYDGKKKSTGQPYSVFVFERSSLNAPGQTLRSNHGLKAAQDEVVDRLKKEVGLLARMRHPNILELVEPVEESRSGLMFVTEVVVGSLQSVLDDKSGSGDSRRRRRAEIEIDELEIQKGLLQLAKGLEFLHESAGLVHGNLTPESIFVNAKSDWKIAGLAFSASHRGESSSSGTSPSPSPSPMPVDLVSLAGQHDQRLPSVVQLNLDYCSPDLLLDSSVTPAHDLFSLGLFIITLYNNPHESPLKAHNSPTNFRRLFNSSSSIPNQSNNFLCSKPIPQPLVDDVLPRLITRRPVNRLTAKEFQEAGYFDNILVSTIRFLDTFPAKSANEKNAFMRGLPKVLPQFPTGVAQRKILPMLVEELKDKGELLPWTLAAVLTLVEGLPAGSRLIGEKILPAFRATFDVQKKKDANGEPISSSAPRPGTERDGRDAALAVMLERLATLREKCTASEFREDILPLYLLALDSPTSHLQGLALKSLGQVLPNMTFNAVKSDIFPVVSTVFSKTSSLGIKIACFESLRVLCGGGITTDDGLNGEVKAADGSSVCLDRFTVQEKVVPLIKGIKTREPAVMMAALELYMQIGSLVDSTTLALEVIPALWGLALGPLLNMQQFKTFMTTIKQLSNKVEQEQMSKLAGTATDVTSSVVEFGAGAPNGAPKNGIVKQTVEAEDFEELVFGKKTGNSDRSKSPDPWSPAATAAPSKGPASAPKKDSAAFSWSTPAPTTLSPSSAAASRHTITPDQSLSGFGALQPNKPGAMMSPPLQPSRPGISSSNSSGPVMGGLGLGMGNLAIASPQPQHSLQPTRPAVQQQSQSAAGIDWTSAMKKPTVQSTFSSSNNSTANRDRSGSNTANNSGWGVTQQKQESHPTILFGQTRQQAPPVKQTEFSGWSIAPPPGVAANQPSQPAFGTGGYGAMQPQQPQQSPPGMNMNMGMGVGMGMPSLQPMQPMQPSKNQKKTGLDAYESLL